MRNHVSAYKDHMLQSATVEQRAVSIVKREQERWNEGTSEWLSAGNMVKDKEQVFKFGPPQGWQLVLLQQVDQEEVVDMGEGGSFPSERWMDAYHLDVADCVRHRRSVERKDAETLGHLKYGVKAQKALTQHLKSSSKERTYFGIEDIVLNKDGSLKAACKPQLSKEEKRKLRFAKRMATKGAAK